MTIEMKMICSDITARLNGSAGSAISVAAGTRRLAVSRDTSFNAAVQAAPMSALSFAVN